MLQYSWNGAEQTIHFEVGPEDVGAIGILDYAGSNRQDGRAMYRLDARDVATARLTTRLHGVRAEYNFRRDCEDMLSYSVHFPENDERRVIVHVNVGNPKSNYHEESIIMDARLQDRILSGNLYVPEKPSEEVVDALKLIRGRLSRSTKLSLERDLNP